MRLKNNDMQPILTSKKRILTGTTTTGIPHLGNYIGMYKPSIDLQKQKETDCFYFLADYHALNKNLSAETYHQSRYKIAATWLALGLDYEKSVFYAQSNVPEIFEMMWIISCFTPKGLMNRAHAYKAFIQEKGSQDTVNMGLFNYPVLMAADILTFNVDYVPVGKDQKQHIEIARDIAGSINQFYKKNIFTAPEALISGNTPLMPGLDGRKMSKSYDNIIPIFIKPSDLKKLIFKIKTDSSLPHEPKNTEESLLFQLYKNFAAPTDILTMQEDYQKGIGWGAVKQKLYDCLLAYFAPFQDTYYDYLDHPKKIDEILKMGAEKARQHAGSMMATIKEMIGLAI